MIVFPVFIALLSALLLFAVRRHALDLARLINAATFRILTTGKSPEVTDEMRAELLFHLEEELFEDVKSSGPQRAAWDSAVRALNLLLNGKAIRRSYILCRQPDLFTRSLAVLNRVTPFLDRITLSVTLIYLLSMAFIAVDFATQGMVPGMKTFQIMTYAFIASQLPKLTLQLWVISLYTGASTKRRLARYGWRLGKK